MAPGTGSLIVGDFPFDGVLIEHVIEWQIAHYAEAFPSFDHADWTEFYSAWVNRGAEAMPVVLAAFDGDACVGTVAIVEHDDLDDERTPWIAAMIVDPAKRGRGIGTQLLAAALLRCKNEGIRRVHLWTHDQADWYHRSGWTSEETRVFRGVEITVFSRVV